MLTLLKLLNFEFEQLSVNELFNKNIGDFVRVFWQNGKELLEVEWDASLREITDIGYDFIEIDGIKWTDDQVKEWNTNEIHTDNGIAFIFKDVMPFSSFVWEM